MLWSDAVGHRCHVVVCCWSSVSCCGLLFVIGGVMLWSSVVGHRCCGPLLLVIGVMLWSAVGHRCPVVVCCSPQFGGLQGRCCQQGRHNGR